MASKKRLWEEDIAQDVILDSDPDEQLSEDEDNSPSVL
jgi:hypothetical protein